VIQQSDDVGCVLIPGVKGGICTLRQPVATDVYAEDEVTRYERGSHRVESPVIIKTAAVKEDDRRPDAASVRR
jgi:hypothetical protein